MSRVTTVVVSHNSRAHLAACLASAAATDLLVVDNASTDGGPALVAGQFPAARLVANAHNRGFAAAANQGLALAGGEFVLLLNPDAVLLPGALDEMVRFLDAHPRAAAAGPRQWLDAARTWQWSVVPWPPHWTHLAAGLPGLRRLGLGRRSLAAAWRLNRAIWLDDAPCAVPYLSGACLLLRRAALQAVGGLDEGYFLFLEDVDLAGRLRAAGWSLHAVPAAGVIHPAMHTVAGLPDRGRGHLQASTRRYLARHGDLLTRVLWAARAWRQARRRPAPGAVPLPAAGPAPVLRWPPVPGAAGYWLEVSPAPTFLYSLAARPAEAACPLPAGWPAPHPARPGRRPLYCRVAALGVAGEASPQVAFEFCWGEST